MEKNHQELAVELPITRRTKLCDIVEVWFRVKLDSVYERIERFSQALRRWGSKERKGRC